MKKTGTTAIQQELKNLASTGQIGFREESHLLLRKPEVNRRWARNVVKDLKRHDVVLSSEEFLGSRLLGGDPSYEAERVKHLIQSFGHDNTIVLITWREFSRWLPSMYEWAFLAMRGEGQLAERLSSFLGPELVDPFPIFVNELERRIDPKNLRVIAYHPDHLVSCFCETIGFEGQDNCSDSRRLNVSPSPLAFSVASRLRAADRRHELWLQRFLLTRHYPDLETKFSLLDAATQETVNAAAIRSSLEMKERAACADHWVGDFEALRERAQLAEVLPSPSEPSFQAALSEFQGRLVDDLSSLQSGRAGQVSRAAAGLANRSFGESIAFLVRGVWHSLLKRPIRRFAARLGRW